MLEQKDLQAIRDIMQEVVEPVKEELQQMDKAILDEVVRVHEFSIEQSEQLNKNIQELKQYYRVLNLEKDNTNLLIRYVEKLEKRIEELENKIA